MSQVPASALSCHLAADWSRQLQIQVRGMGTPTLILLTGLGTPASWWHTLGDDTEDILGMVARDAWGDEPFLGPELARTFRVVSYDRAGLRGSTPPEHPRTLENFLLELEAVLHSVAVDGPVILVGHSIGGLIALEYARRHPQRMRALVLLDSSHPDQLARFAAVSSPEQLQQESQERQRLIVEHPERPDLDSLLGQGQAAAREGLLGAVPLLVISRGSRPGKETDLQDLGAVHQQPRESVWQDLQRELAALSRQGQHLQLSSHHHYVYLDQPGAVLQAMTAFLTTLPPGEGSRPRHPVPGGRS